MGEYMRTALTTVFCWILAVTSARAWQEEQDKPPALNFLQQLGPIGGGGGSGEDLQLSGQFQVAEGGREGRLSITAEMTPSWHVYSLTQKPGATQKSELQVADSEHFKLLGPFQADSPPKIKNVEYFPVPIEEHSDKVVWTAPLRISEGVDPPNLRFKVTYTGQLCQDEGVCIPITKPVDVVFAGYFQSPKPTGDYRASNSHVAIGGYVKPNIALPGTKIELVLTATPDPNWHVYSYAKRDPDKISKPTLVAITQPVDWKVEGPQASAEPVAHETGFPDDPIEYYHEGQISWTFEIEIPADAAPGQRELAGLIGYQVCDESSCDIPTGAAFTAMVTVGAPSDVQAERLPLAFGQASYDQASEAVERLSSRTAVAASPSDFDNQPLAVIFGFAFLAGLILNVMPCVLPVIGLKIMSFVQQAGESRVRVFSLNLAYSLGLLVVFWALATAAFFLQLGWGDQFSNAGFNIVLASIVFVFGLSLLGVWEIPIPGFVGSGKAGEMAEREGVFGAFCKGMLTTVLATPCTGPFLGPAIGWAIQQEAWLNYSTFTCVGVGMASPYLLIGAFPQLIGVLPKPGAWMSTFKEVMGFVLMGTVVFIFFFLDDQYTISALALLVTLGFACWLIGRTPMTAPFGAKLRAWLGGTSVAALTAVLAFYFVPNILFANELPWSPYTRASLDEQLAKGNTVLVDFTADW